MRHSLLAVAVLTAVLAACKAEAPTTPASSPAGTAASTSEADAAFASLSKRWLDGWLQLNPVGATQVGDHRFDSEVDDLSATGRQKLVDFSKKLLAVSIASSSANSFLLKSTSFCRPVALRSSTSRSKR